MTADEQRIDARDWSLLGVLSVLWGGSFFFNGLALRELPPLTVVFLRVALAAFMLLPLLWIYRIGFPAGFAGWKPFFAVALLNNVLPFSLIVIGQTYLASGLASILNATTPLFTVVLIPVTAILLGYFVLDESISPREIVGALVIGSALLLIDGRAFDLVRDAVSIVKTSR